MSKRMKQTFTLTVVAAALLSAYGSALAEDIGNPAVLPANSVAIGIGNWSDDRYQRGIYDGMRDSGGYLLLDADVLQRDDATGTWLGLKARNLGLDDREIKGEWLRQGDIGVSLEYSRIPRVFPYDYNTGLQGIGTTTLLVPSPSITPGTGANVELGTKRDRITAKFVKHFGTALKLNVSFRNEDKDGTRPYGRGGAAEFAVEPVDSTIRLLETTLSYSRDRLQLSGGYYGTSYSTNNKLITTSRTTLAANTTYQLSQPLDNMSHELFLNGGYNFTPTTRGTLKASYSRATQDEFLPTATPGLVWQNAGSVPDPRAPTHLGGKIETTMFELGLNARPMPKLSIVGNLRYRDFADKTPIQQYVYSGTQTWNTPWSYTDKIGKLEGTYRLAQGYSVLGGIEIKNQDRSTPPTTFGTIRVPFVKRLDNNIYRVQLRKSMSETVNGTLAYVREDRTGKDYVASGTAEENLIHPMNIADRTRDKVRAMLDWSPADKLNLQFALEDASDKYGNGPNGNPLGIQKGTGSLYSVDASYQVQSDWDVHAWISRDESKADEITYCGSGASCSNGSGGTNRKINTLKETGTSFGIGVKGKVSDRLKVGGSAEQFRTKNVYNQTLVGSTITAGLVPTPDITNTLLRLKLFAQYAMRKNTDLRFNVIHERYTTNDWSWTSFPATGAAPFVYGTTTDGTTVLADQKQESTFIGVQYIYKFK